jgi:hypothetical protein
MFHQIKLPNGHAAISWLAADARRVMVYREAGACGPDDHGAIIASRDLPVDATPDDVAALVERIQTAYSDP